MWMHGWRDNRVIIISSKGQRDLQGNHATTADYVRGKGFNRMDGCVEEFLQVGRPTKNFVIDLLLTIVVCALPRALPRMLLLGV